MGVPKLELRHEISGDSSQQSMPSSMVRLAARYEVERNCTLLIAAQRETIFRTCLANRESSAENHRCYPALADGTAERARYLDNHPRRIRRTTVLVP